MKFKTRIYADSQGCFCYKRIIDYFLGVIKITFLMKKLFIIAVGLLMCSCTMNRISSNLVSSYQKEPFFTTSDKSFNQVWEKVIDIFAQKGIGINVIDKSSGIIVSSIYSFEGKVTMEQRSGLPGDSTAWVTVGYYGLEDETQLFPSQVFGSFNVRIKEENGKTLINVNLSNLKASEPRFPLGYIKNYYIPDDAKHQYDIESTGVFERYIADMIK